MNISKYIHVYAVLAFFSTSIFAGQGPEHQSMDEQVHREAREFQRDFNKMAGSALFLTAIGTQIAVKEHADSYDYIASAAAIAMMTDGSIRQRELIKAHKKRNDTKHNQAVINQIWDNRKQKGFVRHFIQPVLPIAIPLTGYHPASFITVPLAAPAYGIGVNDCIKTCKSCGEPLLNILSRCSGSTRT